MSKAFDRTLRHLLEHWPEDWLRLAGVREWGTIQSVDADLATVSPEADKVFLLSRPAEWLLHLEFQAGYDADLPHRVHLYNTLVHHRHRKPAGSVVFLLRRQADGPAMTGVLRRERPEGRTYLEFQYDVIRVWELSADTVLAGGLGVLPLAPIADDASDRLAEIVRQIETRTTEEASPSAASELLTSTSILMGLRYPSEITIPLFQGIRAMRESSTFQWILEEGRQEGRQ
ncbi:MAG: Rpn family recombination-promoting nuclease/putative transposase, partial [Planctomycetaceae bacterium]